MVTSDWQINLFNVEGLLWKPLSDVELQSHVLFIPPRRRNLPGQIVRSIRFGGFNVEWKEEKFIVYIASVSILVCSLSPMINCVVVGSELRRYHPTFYFEGRKRRTVFSGLDNGFWV